VNVFLTVSAQPLGIPYWREPSDAASAGYIDLKGEPHRLDEVPEIKGWPSLHELLGQLNTAESHLMSLGCGVFIYPPNGSSQLQWSAFAYVGYCFADLSQLTDARIYFPHFFHFCRHYAAQTNTGANVFFELRETGFYDRNAQGFSLDYVVRAEADSEDQLRRVIAFHFDALSDFLPLMGLTPGSAHHTS